MSNTAIVLISFTCLMVLLGFIFPKKHLLLYIQLIWMIILIGLNSYAMDWNNNLNVFLNAKKDNLFDSGIFMVLYNYLSLKAKNLGFDFTQLNFILSTIATLFIFRVIKKYAKNPCMVMALLYIYPVIDNVIQKRWYYAMGIIIVGLPLLLEEKNKIKKCVGFALVCLLACQFHVAAIFYFLFLIFEFIPEKYKNRVITVVCVIEFIFINYLPKILGKIGILSGKINLYFSVLATNSNIYKFGFWVCIHLSVVILVYCCYRKSIKREVINKFDKFIWNLNVLSFLILPLYSYDPVFIRLFRSIIVFNYIYITNHLVISNYKVNRSGLLYCSIQILLASGMFVIFYFITGLGFENLVIPVFENNLFSDWVFK